MWWCTRSWGFKVLTQGFTLCLSCKFCLCKIFCKMCFKITFSHVSRALLQKRVCEAPSKDHIPTDHFGGRKFAFYFHLPPYRQSSWCWGHLNPHSKYDVEGINTNIFFDHTHVFECQCDSRNEVQRNISISIKENKCKGCSEILDFPIFCKARCTHTHMCVCIHMLILEGVKIYWAVDGCLSSWSIWVYLVWRTTCKKTCLLDQVLVIYEIDPHFGAPFSFKSKSSLVWLLLKFHLFILKAYTYPPSFQIWLWMMTLCCHLNFGATSHHLAWRMRCQALKKCMRDH